MWNEMQNEEDSTQQSDNVDEDEERWEATANAKAQVGEFLQ